MCRQTGTILAWYRRLVARKFDGSKFRTAPGRPRIGPEIEALIVCFARENSGWGYDRIVGALANLGHAVFDQTVGNILRRYGTQPATKRSQNTTWKHFIASHMAVLEATDFFAVEVFTWRGLVTYYVLFFMRLESRRVSLAGLTRHPTAEWIDSDGSQRHRRGFRIPSWHALPSSRSGYKILHCVSGCRAIERNTPLALPPRSPNLNAFAERWVNSIRQECLSKLILFGEASLRRALTEYIEHHHFERNHQGKATCSSSLLQTYR